MDELELSPGDRDRLLYLVERKLPHLLDEPARIDWYVAEVLSYWQGKARAGRRDWPMTVINRMLRLEVERHHGQLPDPAHVRAEQAERRLAQEAVRNAEHDEARWQPGRGLQPMPSGMTLTLMKRCPACSSTQIGGLEGRWSCDRCGKPWPNVEFYGDRKLPREVG